MSPISHSDLHEQSAILTFWFGQPIDQQPAYAQQRKLWFRKDDQTDQTIRREFGAIYDAVASGNRQSWRSSAQGALAMVIVLDQFSRNMFRGTPQAFATDSQALEIAKGAIARNFDQDLFPSQRIFFYLPFEHSENRDHQQKSVELFRRLASQHSELKDVHDYALKHQAVIERFGRFPHRNNILGRSSTPEEIEFLQQPGSSF